VPIWGLTTGGSTLFLASDSRLWLEGLSRLLLEESRFAIVGEGACDARSVEAIASLDPGAVLVDMSARDALIFLLSTASRCGEASLVAVGIDDRPQELLERAGWGIAGYTPRDVSISGLIRVLAAVTAPPVRPTPRDLVGPPAVPERRTTLSNRELQILEYVRQGLSNKEIARALGIEAQTVKNHVHNLLSKLEVRSRGQAAALGRKPSLRALT